jgi:hypothetical protein
VTGAFMGIGLFRVVRLISSGLYLAPPFTVVFAAA